MIQPISYMMMHSITVEDLKSEFKPAQPQGVPAGAFMGIRFYTDDTMPVNQVRAYDRDGNLLRIFNL